MGRESSYGKARPNDTTLKLPRITPYHKRNEPQVCSFFVRGECTRGVECTYRHEMPATDEVSHQNTKDRFYGLYESVALKVPNRAGDMPALRPPEDENIRTLFVGGIYGRLSEQDIRDHFYAYGQLESVMMVPQRGCAFVTFTTRKGAEKAANELADNLEIKGMRLKLMWGRLKTPKAGSEPASNEQRQQSVSHNGLLTKDVTSQQQNQTIQPPRTAAGQDQPPQPPSLHYVNVPLPSPLLGRPFYSLDPLRMGAVIPSQDGSAVIGSGTDPDDLLGHDVNSAERTEELPRTQRKDSYFRLPVGHCGVGINASVKASEGVSEDLLKSSVGVEQVEPRSMPSGGVKRSSDPLEAMSPQEMRERVMKRKKGSSTSTPPVSPSVLAAPDAATPFGVDVATQVGSAAVGESSEETPLTRFVTSFPRDFLLEKSGVTTLWPDADALLFPGPMQLLEKKSDTELVNDITEMSLKAVQAALMSRRRLLAQLAQQDVWRARLAEAEAAEMRMSSQLREAAAQVQSLKEAAAAAEARAAAAEARAAAAMEARKAREALLMTADAQIREMTEKMRRKSEEIREERKDAASSAALRARAKLMREFLDGKSSSWDPQAEIDFYVAHIGEEADLVSKDTPVDVSTHIAKSSAPADIEGN
ncbi:hypothetical protein OSB04_016408 [Centaurea solstitialis]|uniref:Uncharacterized protein n=1 Tax=Centaurea solstitialis TaxID=347529 RepID=A0AA38T8L0_9ASTR|nr:hypothetical protein OSB04_016408 [Centaurea solstitialis]